MVVRYLECSTRELRSILHPGGNVLVHRMRRVWLHYLLLALASLVVGCRKGVVGPGGTLLLDEFNSENGGKGEFNYTDFSHWKVIDGCVDLHGNGFVDVLPGNGLYVDLDGTCANAGTIETKETFSLQSGNYLLELRLAGNQRDNVPDTVTVSLGDIHSEQFVFQPDDPFRLITRTIAVTRRPSAKLRIKNSGSGNQGALLKLVKLTRQ